MGQLWKILMLAFQPFCDRYFENDLCAAMYSSIFIVDILNFCHYLYMKSHDLFILENIHLEVNIANLWGFFFKHWYVFVTRKHIMQRINAPESFQRKLDYQ